MKKLVVLVLIACALVFFVALWVTPSFAQEPLDSVRATATAAAEQLATAEAEATEVVVTPTPTATPTDTPAPTEMPSPSPAARPTPELLEPEAGFRTTAASFLLKWQWSRALEPDEWFDVQIRPEGQPDSVFVDWSKTTEYELSKTKWTTCQAGAYT